MEYQDFKAKYANNKTFMDSYNYSPRIHSVYNSSTSTKKITDKIYSRDEFKDLMDTFKTIEVYWYKLIRNYLDIHGEPKMWDCTIANGFVVWTKFNKERNARQRYIASPSCTQSGTVHEMFIKQVAAALKEEGIDATFNYGRLD